jgi:hypothetical protein
MMVVYFDWNIFAHFRDWRFKRKKAFSNYKILEELKNSGRIETYYSDAHIIDLMPAHELPNFMSQDMNAITQLTDNTYIEYDAIEHSELKEIVDPRVIFHNVKNTFSLNQSMDTIEQTCGPYWPMLEEKLMNMELSIEDNGDMSASGTDLKSYMDKLFTEHNNALNDTGYFKLRREQNLKNLQKIPEYRPHLSGTEEQKISVFVQLFPILISCLPASMKNRSDLLLAMFMLLDQLHLWADSNYKNMMIDALHAFYASHIDTDVLITNDNNFRNKATVAYQVLGIMLPILSFDEFLEIIKRTT